MKPGNLIHPRIHVWSTFNVTQLIDRGTSITVMRSDWWAWIRCDCSRASRSTFIRTYIWNSWTNIWATTLQRDCNCPLWCTCWLQSLWWSSILPTFQTFVIISFLPWIKIVLVKFLNKSSQFVTSPSGRSDKLLVSSLSVSSSDITFRSKPASLLFLAQLHVLCVFHTTTRITQFHHDYCTSILNFCHHWKQVYTPFVFAEGSCCFLPKAVSGPAWQVFVASPGIHCIF